MPCAVWMSLVASSHMHTYLSSEVENDELGGVEAGLGVARALAEMGVVVQLRVAYQKNKGKKHGRVEQKSVRQAWWVI